MAPNETYPYQELIPKLVKSVMRAQHILVDCYIKKEPLQDQHSKLTNEFLWLVDEYKQKRSFGFRHFFDELDTNKAPLGATSKDSANDKRITRLILMSFENDLKTQSKLFIANSSISITSPLKIVFDFLTIPNSPGSTAYALLGLRSYLFGQLRITTITNNGNDLNNSIVIKELSSIWTSIRPRYYNNGSDKFPIGSENNPETALIRHFLAMKGVLRFYFKNIESCKEYLKFAELIFQDTKNKNYPFELEKSPLINKLPDSGEIINELFGLPIPIRGADVLFRGGLKFSSNNGLVMAIHGGPGSGKTSLALSLGAYLSPMGISTLYIGEEDPDDLKNRIPNLIPEDISRLLFFKDFSKNIEYMPTPKRGNDKNSSESDHELINTILNTVKSKIIGNNETRSIDKNNNVLIPKPCQAIIIFDGLHDYFSYGQISSKNADIRKNNNTLYELIDNAKVGNTLVIFTTGEELEGHSLFDFLVDIAIHLSQEYMGQYSAKPDRQIRIMKARHQLCALGTHGLQISGDKGVHFSPQINYQIDKKSLWNVKLPDKTIGKDVLQRTQGFLSKNSSKISHDNLFISKCAPKIFSGSHIFINGEGSGGKAVLALKIAMAPSFKLKKEKQNYELGEIINKDEKILVISFLFPEDYYIKLKNDLIRLRKIEYYDNKKIVDMWQTHMDVIHLYPGYLKPNDLYNRIEWQLDSAELHGDPYTTIIIDGIHNVFLQFPAIEEYKLFWPQMYNSLRDRSAMTITTHTMLAIKRAVGNSKFRPYPHVDNDRSEPLRHALVQKTDFQFEVDQYPEPKENEEDLSSYYAITTMSAIGQPIPKGNIIWNRESFIFYEEPKNSKQPTLI